MMYFSTLVLISASWLAVLLSPTQYSSRPRPVEEHR